MLCRLSRATMPCAVAVCLVIPATSIAARDKSADGLTMAEVNEAQWQKGGKPTSSLLVKIQILLDRAHVSPGVIDGKPGENTRKAIAAFKIMNGLEPNDEIDEQLWRIITERDKEPALVNYTISKNDTAGPFANSGRLSPKGSDGAPWIREPGGASGGEVPYERGASTEIQPRRRPGHCRSRNRCR
jgi:peptidoglycan hydrolase-like protein with peptidoglycan-binding domain